MAQIVRPAGDRGRFFSAQRADARPHAAVHPRHFRGRHHAAAISVVVLLVVVTFQIFPRHDVTVLSDGRAVRVSTTFDAPSEALAAAEVNVESGDRALYGIGGRYRSVAVQHARSVQIQVDGKLWEKRTQMTTVGGALADAGIELGSNDRYMIDGKPAALRSPLVSSLAGDQAVPTGFAPGDVAAIPVRITVVRARPVTIYVDTQRIDAASSAETVDGLLAELNMTVLDSDLVKPGVETAIVPGMVIRLAKARLVPLRIDGRDSSLYTQATTVADVLKLLTLDPGEGDLLDPPRDTVLTDGMTVVVGTTRTFEEEVSTEIAPATVFENDTSQPASYYKVIAGSAGIRMTRYRVTLKNGTETSRIAIGSPRIQTPATPTRRISGGSRAQIPIAGAAGVPQYYTKKLTNVQATWYNASHGGKAADDPWYGITADGSHLDYGICATDWSYIPRGTLMYIPGYGNCRAADTGGAINGAHIDLGYPESVGDPGWGNRYIDVYILD